MSQNGKRLVLFALSDKELRVAYFGVRLLPLDGGRQIFEIDSYVKSPLSI